MTEKTKINFTSVKNPALLERVLNDIVDELTAARTLLNELKTDLSAHVHGGVATGVGTSGAAGEIAAADVAQQIGHGQ